MARKEKLTELWDILKYPQLAEKSMNMVETENKLVFIVNKKATKADIKQAIEKAFQVKVQSVSVMTTTKNEKKAFVKLHPDYSASDIASRMGML
jgi:large subunit ribosomal protein L23